MRSVPSQNLTLVSLTMLACVTVLAILSAASAEPATSIVELERIELIPPDGYELYGGADIESRVDREGKIFVAATGETPRGFGGLMWMQRRDSQGNWKAEAIDLGELYPGGRGSLSVEEDGGLYLTQWGHKSQAWRIRIPQWKPHPKSAP
jgi:hypothetical protein